MGSARPIADELLLIDLHNAVECAVPGLGAKAGVASDACKWIVWRKWLDRRRAMLTGVGKISRDGGRLRFSFEP